jgi:hypothetical protein
VRGSILVEHTFWARREMAGADRIFVSHIHEDDVHINGMRRLLADGGHEVQVSAVDSSSPNDANSENYIKSEILAPKIDWSSTMVVLISPGTKESKWVDWEIEYAQKKGKRIIGVWTSGAAECDVPQALSEYADAVVGWQADRIEGALSGTINNWTGSDDKPRDRQAIRQHGC